MKTATTLLVAVTLASCISTPSYKPYDSIATTSSGDTARTMTLQRSSAATLAPPQVPDSAPTAAATQAVQLTVASRQLNDVPWAPVEDGTAFGLAYSYEGPTLGYELGLQYTSAYDDSVRDVQGVPWTFSLQLETLELYGGVRKTFFEGASIRPYVGAGVTLIQANSEAAVNGAPSDSDDVGFGG